MNSNPVYNNKKASLIASRTNFRSRGGFNSKQRQKQAKSIDESSVVRYGTNKDGPNPLPKKFMKMKDRVVQVPKPNQVRNRVLHSSFYMHKLHNRASTSIQGSRAESQTRNS